MHPKVLSFEYDFLDLNPKNLQIMRSNQTRIRPPDPNIVSFFYFSLIYRS